MAISPISATSGGTSTSYAVSVSGTNPTLEVLISAQTGVDIVTGVTWNGETLSRIAYTAADTNTALWMYACIPVGTGSQSLVISLSLGAVTQSTSVLYNGGGLPSNGATNFSAIAATSGSVSVTAADGDWIIGGVNAGGGSVTAGPATTIRDSQGALKVNAADSNGTASPTIIQFNFANGSWAAIGAKISPINSSSSFLSLLI